MKRKAANTRWLRKYKQSLRLSAVQKNVIIGTLLGDGYLQLAQSKKSARLQVRQGYQQEEYVYWKYKVFKNWVFNKPYFDCWNNSFVFTTIHHKALLLFRKLFYRNKKRIVPQTINKLLNSPLSLAVWLMDDGNGYPHLRAFRISSYGFGIEGNKMLQQVLQKNFSLSSNILYEGEKKGHCLYIPVRNALHLYKLAKPYILPCMAYKFTSLKPRRD